MPISEGKPYLKRIELIAAEGQTQFPFDVQAIKKLNTLQFDSDVTFLVGENGSGKSTILEAIADLMGFGAQGGTGNFKIRDAGTTSLLAKHLKPTRSVTKPRDKYFLRAESFYNVATFMDSLAREEETSLRMTKQQVLARYGGKSLHERSHGESFMSAMVDGFSGKGFYLLDEPEAALSPARQLAALVRIHDLVCDQSQFIIATHSPILLAYPRSTIISLDDTGCHSIPYEQTAHYRVTKDFLNNYPKRVSELLSN